MWRELAARALNAGLTDGASARQLREAETQLGIALPDELRDLLAETDGIVAEYGVNLVWPVDRIVADNLAFRANEDFRALYMPFDPLLFFGDAGNGDQFAYAILADGVRQRDIFAWDHETDSRSYVAFGLRQLIEGWASGSIRL